MNKERSLEIEFIRSEMVGPARPLAPAHPGTLVTFDSMNRFKVEVDQSGSTFWRPEGTEFDQEVITYRRETPIQRYGIGLLHPMGELSNSFTDTTEVGNQESDDENLVTETAQAPISDNEDSDKPPKNIEDSDLPPPEQDDDFEVASENVYKPSVMGLSFCINDVEKDDDGEIIVTLPSHKKFSWQLADSTPYQVNGAYEKCTKIQLSKDGGEKLFDAWRRLPAVTGKLEVKFKVKDLRHGKKKQESITLPSGLSLSIEVFPRKIFNSWVLTCVLRNKCDFTKIKNTGDKIRNTLFQTYFEIKVSGKETKLSRYPEGKRPFDQYDEDEQSLALLYQNSATWAIGHGCAAAWETEDGETPDIIFADCMPAVELPSMTPDIQTVDGKKISVSMRDLSTLSITEPSSLGWKSIESLCEEYAKWIKKTKLSSEGLDRKYTDIARKHMDSCDESLSRIQEGLYLLKTNPTALEAFRLANQAMMLQQIAAKQISPRPLELFEGYVAAQQLPDGALSNPWEVWNNCAEKSDIGHWRAFQIAFLLMNISSFINEDSNDRQIVDLIWFPTGGGKTEAYLGVAAFYMFLQRLITKDSDTLKRNGTNVFMRYTLRMLTTQQFQRAANLICSMEVIRRERKKQQSLPQLGDREFSLGLWVGGAGSPNKWKDAQGKINKFAKDGEGGNPLVLTECPWCRSTIGRFATPINRYSKNKPKSLLSGFGYNGKKPYLKCSDSSCMYGGEYSRLPIEVIDEALYETPPSMFIGTADKLAMMSRKPESGSLFGFKHTENGPVKRISKPPGLIIQDEFHLISGPLGTIYGLYEGVFEKLCTDESSDRSIPPKIIASTATIRGAVEQVNAVYAREQLQLFPSPGIEMSDSFFGRYAKDGDKLSEGRLYLGIHATGYKSFLTTQVRAFSAALFRPKLFDDNAKDPWWTLLAFYNSLRELGGARTLFTSDIDARMKDYSFRYGLKGDDRRFLKSIEELTSRRSQAELVALMDRLSIDWDSPKAIDACLASNIIEVGVDIDRLSLMAVVGQPKSTAQYIQVTGRVGRKWWERPGLIMSMYNPAKSRDLSHFEQFHSYHRRLYERVEPTSATPFSVEAVKKALAGALLLWVRQKYDAKYPGSSFPHFERPLRDALEYLQKRCHYIIKHENERERVIKEMDLIFDDLVKKWGYNPQLWTEYPQTQDGEYLMLWPGEYATPTQKDKGLKILSSMRNVDSNARAIISNNYFRMGHNQDV